MISKARMGPSQNTWDFDTEGLGEEKKLAGLLGLTRRMFSPCTSHVSF